MQNQQRIPGSFRDPNGFLYIRDGVLYRQINNSFQQNFSLFNNSGLYAALVDAGYLIKHEELEADQGMTGDAFRVIRPEPVPYISYPYEWCFSQLKDAALLTLKIQQLALVRGMTLKDASAYNVQFHGGKPVFIDTLSFEAYEQGAWVAYKQFCQHFLAPLVLKTFVDRRLSQLLRTNIDGVPLDLASKLLPRRTWFNYSVLAHMHLHARAQAKYADSARAKRVKTKGAATLSKARLIAMIEQLASMIDKLEPKRAHTEWGEYYADTNYPDGAMSDKKSLIDRLLGNLKRNDLKVIDMGANDGQFSRVALSHASLVISQDIDEVAVEKNYLKCKRSQGAENLLPLVQDLTNPSPAIGWANAERMGLTQRGRVDVILALALIHHIAITNNVPLMDIARFFHQQTDYLIIEFVPKSDSQVQRMLATRKDIFSQYDQENFERVFSECFTFVESERLQQSERTLYLLEAKGRQ